MTNSRRGNVWLAAAGLVIKDNKWLVVKKRYGGLKGKWSLPAGFVNENETVDEAAVREVFEETGIQTKVIGLAGIRSGVIKGKISDNMLVFLLSSCGGAIKVQQDELYEVAFKTPEELKEDKDTSMMIHYFMENNNWQTIYSNDKVSPGEQFGYTSYKIHSF
jgi:8-oxo-dGTP diphosphatase